MFLKNKTNSVTRPLSSRDKKVIYFLWKYKIATMAMLYERFYEGVSHRTAYNSIVRLRREGYVILYLTKNLEKKYLGITAKALRVIKESHENLMGKHKRGMNIEKDIITTALLTGPFLKEEPPSFTAITNRMLWRLPYEDLPGETPYQHHKPDGFMRFGDGKFFDAMAVQVETRVKPKSDYKQLAISYQCFRKENRVLWVVENKPHAVKILDALYEHKALEEVHMCIYKKSFLKNGWNTKIINGPSRGKSLWEIMRENSGVLASNKQIRMYTDCLQSAVLTHGFSRAFKKEKI